MQFRWNLPHSLSSMFAVRAGRVVWRTSRACGSQCARLDATRPTYEGSRIGQHSAVSTNTNSAMKYPHYTLRVSNPRRFGVACPDAARRSLVVRKPYADWTIDYVEQHMKGQYLWCSFDKRFRDADSFIDAMRTTPPR